MRKHNFHYDWYAANIGGEFPILSCNSIGCVCEPLHARCAGHKLTLTGRFGVFVGGAIQTEFYDKQHRVLSGASSSTMRIPVSPLEPLVLRAERSKAIEFLSIPKRAARIAIVMHDAHNVKVGELADAKIEHCH